jgi:hypothetical protein
MHSISRLVASGYVTRAAPFGTPLSSRGCYSHVGGETLPLLTDMQKKGISPRTSVERRIRIHGRVRKFADGIGIAAC